MSQLVLISTNENPNSCNKWIHPQTEKLNIWNYFRENNLQAIEERKSAIHKVKTVLQQDMFHTRRTGKHISNTTGIKILEK